MVYKSKEIRGAVFLLRRYLIMELSACVCVCVCVCVCLCVCLCVLFCMNVYGSAGLSWKEDPETYESSFYKRSLDNDLYIFTPTPYTKENCEWRPTCVCACVFVCFPVSQCVCTYSQHSLYYSFRSEWRLDPGEQSSTHRDKWYHTQASW